MQVPTTYKYCIYGKICIMKDPRVSIILPTHNESETIEKIISDIQKLKSFFSLEIIVADGGSNDGTVTLARRKKVTVLSFPRKRGKGIDFWEAAKIAKGEYIVQIDADYQFLPSEIPVLVQTLDYGADLAIGKRTDQGNAPITRTFGNFTLSLIASLLIGRRIHDLLAGFKAARASVLLSLKLTEPHFGYEAETVIKSIRMGYKVAEVPVYYTRRNTGASQVNALRDGLLILLAIFKASFRQLPNRTKL